MSWINQVEPRDIGGRTFMLRAMPFVEGRSTFSRLQKVLAGWTENEVTAATGMFFFAGMSGTLSDEDLKFFCDKFGAYTTVQFDGGRELTLNKPEALNEAFAGQFSVMYAWLDECAKFHFGDMLAKLQGALAPALAKRLADQSE